MHNLLWEQDILVKKKKIRKKNNSNLNKNTQSHYSKD